MSPGQKILAQLVQSIGKSQLFFLAWAAIVGLFTLMMLSFYRQNTRRNFRAPGDPGGPKVGFDPRLPRSGAAGDKRNSPGR